MSKEKKNDLPSINDFTDYSLPSVEDFIENSSDDIKKNLDENDIKTKAIILPQGIPYDIYNSKRKITDKKIKWHIVGEGRYFKELNNLKSSNKLDNLYLHGLKKYSELKNYVQFADIMLISLKKGKTFDSTITGKFSTYINYNKFIFGLILLIYWWAQPGGKSYKANLISDSPSASREKCLKPRVTSILSDVWKVNSP